MSFLDDPVMVAALVSALVALLTPYLAAQLRERSRERVEASAAELQGQAQFYRDLQARLERTERENDELDERVLLLERALLDRDARLGIMEDDLKRIRSILEAEPPEIATALALLVQVLDRIRRGERERREA